MRRILLACGLFAASAAACGGDATGTDTQNATPRKTPATASAAPFAPFGEPAVSDPIAPVSDQGGLAPDNHASDGKPTPDWFGVGGYTIPDESFGTGVGLPTKSSSGTFDAGTSG